IQALFVTVKPFSMGPDRVRRDERGGNGRVCELQARVLSTLHTVRLIPACIRNTSDGSGTRSAIAGRPRICTTAEAESGSLASGEKSFDFQLQLGEFRIQYSSPRVNYNLPPRR